MDLLNLEEWTDRDQPVSPQPKNLLKEYREIYTQMHSSIRIFEEQDRNPLSDPELAYYLAADSRRLPDDAPDSIDHGTAAAAAVEGPAKRLIPSKMANHPLIQKHSKTPSPTQMVCSGPVTDQMKRLKMFSLLTSTAELFVALTVMAEMGKAGMGVVTMMASVTGILTSVPDIFTPMTPVLVHLAVRNYVAWLKYDPAAGRYTASTLMLRTRRVTLSAAEVQVPDVPGMPIAHHLLRPERVAFRRRQPRPADRTFRPHHGLRPARGPEADVSPTSRRTRRRNERSRTVTTDRQPRQPEPPAKRPPLPWRLCLRPHPMRGHSRDKTVATRRQL